MAKKKAMLARRGFVSRIHQGKPMPQRTRIANAQKSKVRSAIEHVFAHQKGLLGLTIRTIGLARARVKIGLAYNMRLVGVPIADGMRTSAIALTARTTSSWLRTRYVPA